MCKCINYYFVGLVWKTFMDFKTSFDASLRFLFALHTNYIKVFDGLPNKEVLSQFSHNYLLKALFLRIV